MKTLILYSSKYGTTETCAKILMEKLEAECDLVPIKESKSVNLKEYDQVIVGSSVYLGKVKKQMIRYLNDNTAELLTKKRGFFICCGEEKDNNIDNLFPKALLEKATMKQCFGGEFLFSKMKSMDRFITTKLTKLTDDQSNIKVNRIEDFARVMNRNQK